MKMRLPLSQLDIKPSKPKYPTSDFAYDVAVAIVEAKKLKKKKTDKDCVFNGVDLDI